MVRVTTQAQALKGVVSTAQTAAKKKTKTPSFYPADDVKFRKAPSIYCGMRKNIVR